MSTVLGALQQAAQPNAERHNERPINLQLRQYWFYFESFRVQCGELGHMSSFTPLLRCAAFTAVMCFANPSIRQGNAEGPSKSPKHAYARKEYKHTLDIPDGITFISTGRLTRSVYRTDPDSARAMVSQNFGLGASESEILIQQMMASHDRFSSQFDQRGQEIACDHGAARAVGKGAYQLLDEIDDAEVQLSENQYQQFRKALKSDIAGRFQQWLDKQKLNTEYVVVDHEKMAWFVGIEDTDQQMSALCAGLEN